MVLGLNQKSHLIRYKCPRLGNKIGFGNVGLSIVLRRIRGGVVICVEMTGAAGIN